MDLKKEFRHLSLYMIFSLVIGIASVYFVYLFTEVIEWNYIPSIILISIVGSIIHFLLNRHYTFKSKKSLWLQVPSYVFSIISGTAILTYISYLIVENYQIVYISHFAFFAALSFLFLAFTKLSWGGVYAETRNLVENKKI